MQEGQNQPGVVVPDQQNWQPNAATQAVPVAPQADNQGFQVSWTASEFIAHAKSAGWYTLLFLGAAVAAIGMYLLTKDKVTSTVLVVVALLFGIMAARKPRELNYAVNEAGITVGPKFYPYRNFKSFSVIQEGGVESVWFMPLQRFMPGLTIYFAPDEADKIMQVISSFLPFEPREADLLDRAMHRLRF